MRPRFVVGYDGSAGAQAALALTRRLAAVADADVLAVHVYAPPAVAYPSPMYPVSAPPPDEIERIAREEAQRVIAGARGVEHRVVCSASVAGELHPVARGEGAALLAVGRTHRGAVGRLLPGSIGERLVHGAPCPLLVVPPDAGERPLQRIAVAYDGRGESRKALRVAAALARRAGAALVLMSSADLGPAGIYGPQAPREIDRALGSPLEHSLEDAAERLPDDLETHRWLLSGSAGPALADACREDIDLLVVGSRGRGRIAGLTLGSTSRHLVDHVTCPLLLVGGRTPTARLDALVGGGLEEEVGV